MTDKRDEDSAGKSGNPGSEPVSDKSGAGYGDHAGERQKGENQDSGDQK